MKSTHTIRGRAKNKMDTITSIAQWVFLDSIYGIAIIAFAVYFLSLGIKKVIPPFPNPAILGALAFLITLFTLPSLPRYQFEKEVFSQIEGKDWVRVINKTKWSSLIEPLTWFNTPYGSFFIVSPNSPLEGGFSEVLMQYEREPIMSMSYPECANNTIMHTRPDSEGVYRYTSTKPEAMTEQELTMYCQYDWSKENEALHTEIRKQMGIK